MLTGRHGERLGTWIAAVRAGDLPYLHSFASGLERDHAAVLARAHLALLIWRCRRQGRHDQISEELMSGRADYDLLRKMALLN